jgi:hypothetical protein
MADFLQLPTEVLVQILQLVEVRHRLSNCSLVHSTWAAAALAATDRIDVDFLADNDLDYMLYWLEQHGVEQVTSLQFYAGWQDVSEIPCSKLRDLEISEGVLQLHPADPDYPNMVQTTTGLTRLVLSNSAMACSDSTLSTLSALTDLQHLELAELALPGVNPLGKDASSQDTWAPITGSLFSQLLKLTHLELDSGTGGASPQTFQHLGCLTDLQHLGLTSVWEDYVAGEGWVPTADGMEGLSQLTQLTSLDVRNSVATFTAHSTPRLTPLTNLRQLCLHNVDAIHPSVLAGMTQLQRFKLSDTDVLGGSAGAAALLAALQGMQQLTALDLGHNTLAHVATVPPPAAAQDAHTHRTQLQLTQQLPSCMQLSQPVLSCASCAWCTQPSRGMFGSICLHPASSCPTSRALRHR